MLCRELTIRARVSVAITTTTTNPPLARFHATARAHHSSTASCLCLYATICQKRESSSRVWRASPNHTRIPRAECVCVRVTVRVHECVCISYKQHITECSVRFTSPCVCVCVFWLSVKRIRVVCCECASCASVSYVYTHAPNAAGSLRLIYSIPFPSLCVCARSRVVRVSTHL